MTKDQTFVIVGASLAGAKAAEALREAGFDGRVVLVGAERERPYERPPLSKEYLRGEAGREKIWVHDDEQFYERSRIELRSGSEVTALDAAAREVELAGNGSRSRSCCWRRAPSRARSVSLGRGWRGSTICGPSGTPIICASGSSRAAGSWSWALAGSARR
jgi:hypothetical protein